MKRELKAKAGTRHVDLSFVIEGNEPISFGAAKELLVRLAIYLVDENRINELAAELVSQSPGSLKPRRVK